MLRGSRVVMVGALLLVAGCGKHGEPGGAGGSGSGSGSGSSARSEATAGSAPGSGSAIASGSGSAVARSPLAVDAVAVQAVIDAWLAAQNTGDFAKYSALYGPKLEGVKRAGARTWRLDRKGWLADRKRMFKKPMTVEASGLDIRGNAVIASVTFTQKYTQGAFHDEGGKHMLLLRDASGFHIAREEMLRSVLGADVDAADSVHLVFRADELVVLMSDADPGLSATPGKLEDLGGENPHLAGRTVGPPPLAGRIRVFAADGTECESTLGGLREIGGATLHPQYTQEWEANGLDEDAIAAEVFGMGTTYVVSSITQPSGSDCVPVVALEGTSPAKLWPLVSEAPDAAALAAFRALPAWQDVQSSFEDADGNGPWETDAVTKRFSDGTHEYIAVQGFQPGGCGQFEGYLTVVFSRVGRTLVPLTGNLEGMNVLAIIDSTGAGALQAIGAPFSYSAIRARVDLTDIPGGTDSVSFPFNDCGC